MHTFFAFSRQQKSAVFFLLLCITGLQCLYFFIDFSPGKTADPHPEAWIAFQQQIDSLKQIEAENRKPRLYPFNPNYLTGYKGYTLGMSVAEIDRLSAYRKTGKFINSAREFQQVTQISDSLLRVLQPYFKFPQWTSSGQQPEKGSRKSSEKNPAATARSAAKKDLNAVTAAELKALPGIGEVLSGRIIKFRDRLGGFLVEEQLYDVYGLSAEVAEGVLQRYAVVTPPQIRKININTATAEELSTVAYLRYKAVRALIAYRDSVGKIQSLEELSKIQYIPIEKINRIKLYLKIE